MNYDFWQKQTEKTLFPEIEWNKPEQKSQAGKLVIIGGNKLGFSAVGTNYAKAEQMGAGEVKVILPDVLKKSVPMTDGVFFAESNASGGFSKNAIGELKAMNTWADVAILIGDLGKNSETAIAMEELVQNGGRMIVTRDSVDLLINTAGKLVEREDTIVVATFAQLQKLFRSVYYPKVLTFSMQLMNLVEAMHKFTITYPVTIASFHQENFVVSQGGRVVTTPIVNTRYSPLTLWSGEVAVRSALYWAWNSSKPLEAVASAVVTK